MFKPQVLIQLYDKDKTEIDIYEYASPNFNVFVGDEISTVVFHLSVLPKELKPLMIDRMMCNVSIATPWYEHVIFGAMAEVKDAKLLIYVEKYDAEKLTIKHIKQ